MPREPRIQCPSCTYRPRAEDRWSCVPACGTVWHTFWTGGVCPGCTRAWTQTQCPACSVVSAHKAWYHWPEEAPAKKRRTKAVPAGPDGGRPPDGDA